jgi:chromosome segregation ATPase
MQTMPLPEFTSPEAFKKLTQQQLDTLVSAFDEAASSLNSLFEKIWTQDDIAQVTRLLKTMASTLVAKAPQTAHVDKVIALQKALKATGENAVGTPEAVQACVNTVLISQLGIMGMSRLNAIFVTDLAPLLQKAVARAALPSEQQACEAHLDHLTKLVGQHKLDSDDDVTKMVSVIKQAALSCFDVKDASNGKALKTKLSAQLEDKLVLNDVLETLSQFSTQNTSFLWGAQPEITALNKVIEQAKKAQPLQDAFVAQTAAAAEPKPKPQPTREELEATIKELKAAHVALKEARTNDAARQEKTHSLELKNLQGELTSLQNKHRALLGKAESSSKKLSNAQQNIKSLRKERSSTASEIERLTGQLKKALSTAVTLKKERDSAEQQVELSESRVSTYQGQLEQLDTRRASLEEQLRAARTELNLYKKEAGAYKSQLKAYGPDRLADFERRAGQAEQALQMLQGKLKTLQDTHKKELLAKERGISGLNQRVAKLHKELTNLKGLVGTRSELKAQIAELEPQLEQAQVELQATNNSLSQGRKAAGVLTAFAATTQAARKARGAEGAVSNTSATPIKAKVS